MLDEELMRIVKRGLDADEANKAARAAYTQVIASLDAATAEQEAADAELYAYERKRTRREYKLAELMLNDPALDYEEAQVIYALMPEAEQKSTYPEVDVPGGSYGDKVKSLWGLSPSAAKSVQFQMDRRESK